MLYAFTSVLQVDERAFWELELPGAGQQVQLGLRSAILCLLFRDIRDVTDIAAFCNACAGIATSFLCINSSLGAEGIITILWDVPVPHAHHYNHLGSHCCFIFTFYKQTGRQNSRTSSPPIWNFQEFSFHVIKVHPFISKSTIQGIREEYFKVAAAVFFPIFLLATSKSRSIKHQNRNMLLFVNFKSFEFDPLRRMLP